MSNVAHPPQPEESSDNRTGDDYGTDYLDWKNWSSDDFGFLSKFQQRYFDAEIKRTNRNFAKGSRVLEIGFGSGSFLTFAQNNGWTVTGVEINKELVQIAKNKGFDAVSSDDLDKIDKDTFDLIVAFDVLEHIPQDQIYDFLLKLKNLLKDQGVFIARFPNGDSPFSLPLQNGDITHISYLGANKVRYFTNKLLVDLVYLGGAAQPLIAGNRLHTVHRIFALPMKKLIELCVNAVFYPGSNIAFCSSNLVMMFRRTKTKPHV